MNKDHVEVHIFADVTDHGSLVWWAESPDVEGFYASDETLPALLNRVEAEVQAIAEEEGQASPAVAYALRPAVAPNQGDAGVTMEEAEGSETRRSIVTVEKRLAAA